jgi:hypothetical protein
VIEGLDDITVSDASAWSAVAAALAKVLKASPAEPPAARRLLQTAVDGLKQLAAGSVTDMLAVVDALTESLQAVQAAFTGEPDDGRLSAAAARLAGAFDRKGSEAATEDNGCIRSIDDAAALLIRLEPQDQPGGALEAR